jgi:uncharacterized protein YcnI
VLAVGVAIGGASLLTAPPASAHVHVDPSATTAGGYAVLTFRVPTESTTASTVGLTVTLPADTPFTSVRTEHVPGWTATVTTADLPAPVTDDDGTTITTAPTAVTWTATDGGLAPGEFGELKVSVGPLPESGTVFLPAVQTYSDGTTVAWVEQAQGTAEPEHPAPSFTVSAAPAGGQATGSDPAASAEPPGDTARGATSPWTLGLAVAALAVALTGAALAAVAFVRTRRPASRSGDPGGDAARVPGDEALTTPEPRVTLDA